MANEKRLIFLDHALQAVSSGYISDMPEHDLALLVTARKKLKDLPTVDAVEVVRCRNCIWYEKGKDYEPYCNHPSHGIPYPDDDDFCSYGKRRPENP